MYCPILKLLINTAITAQYRSILNPPPNTFSCWLCVVVVHLTRYYSLLIEHILPSLPCLLVKKTTPINSELGTVPCNPSPVTSRLLTNTECTAHTDFRNLKLPTNLLITHYSLLITHFPHRPILIFCSNIICSTAQLSHVHCSIGSTIQLSHLYCSIGPQPDLPRPPRPIAPVLISAPRAALLFEMLIIRPRLRSLHSAPIGRRRRRFIEATTTLMREPYLLHCSTF